eukprot:14257694-Alexandrium_andersonii.AAC.1
MGGEDVGGNVCVQPVHQCSKEYTLKDHARASARGESCRLLGGKASRMPQVRSRGSRLQARAVQRRASCVNLRPEWRRWETLQHERPVSYTHLTLPTICSV